jgi:hypothetical protein
MIGKQSNGGKASTCNIPRAATSLVSVAGELLYRLRKVKASSLLLQECQIDAPACHTGALSGSRHLLPPRTRANLLAARLPSGARTIGAICGE